MKQNSERLASKADRAAARGQHRKALTIYRRLRAENPSNRRLLHRVADLALEAGADDEARSALKTLIARYVEEGFYDRAIALYPRLIERTEDDLRSRCELARLLARVGRRAEAVALYSRVAEDLEGRGSPTAIEILKQLVALEPRQAKHRIRLARTCWRFQLHSKAIDQIYRLRKRLSFPRPADLAAIYLAVSETDPADRRAIAVLASELLRAGDGAGARELLAYCKIRWETTEAVPAADPATDAEGARAEGKVLRFRPSGTAGTQPESDEAATFAEVLEHDGVDEFLGEIDWGVETTPDGVVPTSGRLSAQASR